MPNPDGLLSSGIYCTIELHIPRKSPSLVVPADAIIFNADGMQVAVAKDGVVSIRKIVVSRDLGKEVEIKDGVNPGEQVDSEPAGRACRRQQGRGSDADAGLIEVEELRLHNDKAAAASCRRPVFRAWRSRPPRSGPMQLILGGRERRGLLLMMRWPPAAQRAVRARPSDRCRCHRDSTSRSCSCRSAGMTSVRAVFTSCLPLTTMCWKSG